MDLNSLYDSIFLIAKDKATYSPTSSSSSSTTTSSLPLTATHPSDIICNLSTDHRRTLSQRLAKRQIRHARQVRTVINVTPSQGPSCTVKSHTLSVPATPALSQFWWSQDPQFGARRATLHFWRYHRDGAVRRRRYRAEMVRSLARMKRWPSQGWPEERRQGEIWDFWADRLRECVGTCLAEGGLAWEGAPELRFRVINGEKEGETIEVPVLHVRVQNPESVVWLELMELVKTCVRKYLGPSVRWDVDLVIAGSRPWWESDTTAGKEFDDEDSEDDEENGEAMNGGEDARMNTGKDVKRLKYKHDSFFGLDAFEVAWRRTSLGTDSKTLCENMEA